MTTFVDKLREDVVVAERRLTSAKQTLNMQELIAQVLDARPKLEGETGISLFSWTLGRSIARIYYVLPRIADILPILEWAERCFGGEFTSSDNSQGVREYSLDREEELGLDLRLTVTPDEASADATCRRVLIGEDVRQEIVRTPKYKLICEGASE